MRYMQLMQTPRFVVFQLANFFLFFFSGKYLITFTLSVMVSSQASRTLSTVAGASKRNIGFRPPSSRAARMASCMAKNALAARNSGGSPIPWKKNCARGCLMPFQSGFHLALNNENDIE